MTSPVVKLLACVGVAGIPLLFASPTLAYTVGSGSSGAAPAVVGGGVSFTFLATFLQASAAAPTAVALSQPSGTRVADSLSLRSSRPNAPRAASAAVPAVLLAGTPVPAGVTVTFSTASGPGHATFSPLTTTTNSSGQASTTVTLPAGYPGQYVLEATLAGGGSVTLTIVEAGGFPNTVADLVRHPVAPLWPVVAGSGAILLVAVLGFTLLRRRQTRRTL
jgi:hypothetical protein